MFDKITSLTVTDTNQKYSSTTSSVQKQEDDTSIFNNPQAAATNDGVKTDEKTIKYIKKHQKEIDKYKITTDGKTKEQIEENIKFEKYKEDNALNIKRYNIDTKDKNQKQLTDEIKKAGETAQNTSDGAIQSAKQGSRAGDCWLLAQMNSLSATDWGKQALKDGIEKSDNGYVVHFNGVGKDITISNEELEKASNRSDISSGDIDARLYEIATEKYFKENKINNKSISGNNATGMNSLQYLLTGTKGNNINDPKAYEPILQVMAKYPENNAGFAVTYTKYIQPTKDDLKTPHAVSVQKVTLNDKNKIDKVYILDSYNPDKLEEVPYSKFQEEMIAIGISRPMKKKETN